MRDGSAERALGFGALDVDVDPLVVTGRFSKEVHPVLVDPIQSVTPRWRPTPPRSSSSDSKTVTGPALRGAGC